VEILRPSTNEKITWMYFWGEVYTSSRKKHMELENGPFQNLIPYFPKKNKKPWFSASTYSFFLGGWVGFQILDEFTQNYLHPPKTNMTIEKQPFEDISPIKHGDFLLSC